MKWIYVRLMPIRSLLDFNIPSIQRALSRLGADFQFRIVDDRASDAFFISVYVHHPEWTEQLWARVKKTFLSLPKVTPYLADEHGEDTPMKGVGVEDLPRFSIRWNGA